MFGINRNVTVKDDAEAGVTSNHFLIEYSVAADSTNEVGKFTGFFFDVTDNLYNSGNLGLKNQTPENCALAFNTDHITGSCGSNLGLGNDAGAYKGHDFNVALAWSDNNEGTGSFEVAAIYDLSLADWGAIALRGQEVGDGGSAKEFQIMADAPSPVPVPAAVWLFVSALIGVFGLKHLKPKSRRALKTGTVRPAFA